MPALLTRIDGGPSAVDVDSTSPTTSCSTVRSATAPNASTPAVCSSSTRRWMRGVVAVTATLAPGRDATDVMAALFPCGSITGAPKVRAMQALSQIEASPRGVYTGAIGRIDASGDAQFNVAIRTLTVGEGSATMGLGGGIVADSRADEEWDEALAKGAFLTAGQRVVDLIETMAFDPLDGIVLLERHP